MSIGFVGGIKVAENYKKQLERVYKGLDYNVTFHELPLARVSDHGYVDAMLILPAFVGDSLTSFVRVPIELDSGMIVLYCIHSEDCNMTKFDSKDNAIAIYNGDNYFNEIVNEKAVQVIRTSRIDQANDLLLMQRVNLMLTIDKTDIEKQLQERRIPYSKYAVEQFKAYHYIHQSKQHLSSLITQQLKKQQKNTH